MIASCLASVRAALRSSSQVNVAAAAGTFDISGTAAGAAITTLNGVASSHVTLGRQDADDLERLDHLRRHHPGYRRADPHGRHRRCSTGANTYSGATTINGGTLQAGAHQQHCSVASAHTVTGTLDLNGFNEAIGSLAGAGTVTNAGATAATLTAGANNTSTTFSGVDPRRRGRRRLA